MYYNYGLHPKGGSTAAPDKFCSCVSVDSGWWKITQSLACSYMRSLALGFCQFLAFSTNWALNSKACQKYCEEGAPSGVVGKCPRIAWAIA